MKYGEGGPELLTKVLAKPFRARTAVIRQLADKRRARKLYMPVKKHQLADMLAERMNVSKKQGMEWLDAFVDEITKVLRTGDKVNITGFGIFKVADRKAREGINPRTGEKIHINASKKPRFTPGKLLKEAVKL